VSDAQAPAAPRSRVLVVSETPQSPVGPRVPWCSADEYLAGRPDTLAPDLAVVNLCRSYQYLSRGYYVSLVADARKHRVHPSPRVIEELQHPGACLLALREAGVDTIDLKAARRRRRVLPQVILPEGAPPPGGAEALAGEGAAPVGAPAGALVLSQGRDGKVGYQPGAPEVAEAVAVCGRTLDRRFRRHCSAVFKVYPVPLLRVRFVQDEGRWKVGQVTPSALPQLAPDEVDLLAEELGRGRYEQPLAGTATRPYRLAVLLDPEDPNAASNEATVTKLARIAAKQGLLVELVRKHEQGRLGEFDALFIRSNTAMQSHTFTWAQTAESLDMPVIDTPEAIIRCSNKVFLHELFRKAGIPTPRTLIVTRKTPPAELEALGWPLVLKMPDGTFSQAVKKADDRAAYERIAQDMFRRSPLLIVQEFLQTPFDWRIGVLDGAPVWCAKYHMARAHWQIVRSTESGGRRYGKVEAVALSAAPPEVLAVALEATALLGEGLYGVDIKQAGERVVVIEVNENPNLEEDEEDAAEGDVIYERLAAAFVRRIQAKAREAAS